MNQPRNPKRRRFLKAAAGALPLASCSGSKSPWRFLTAAEGATLAAIVDQIIPPDQDPGAAWAGVVGFIDRQLMGHYKDLQKAYRDGLAEVDRAAAARFGKPFAQLDGKPQNEVLTALEKDKNAFFALVVTHTMQGYYGDPRHGGNREYAAWKMLGIPFPPVRGRQQYEVRP